MRYEQQNHEGKLHTLRRLHRFINRDFFDSELMDCSIDIASVNSRQDIWAGFSRAGPKIIFVPGFADYMREQRSQRMQAVIMGHVMLHEMIHQYCFQNGIDDSNHAGGWKQAAAEHLLHSIYAGGQLIEETMSPAAESLFYYHFRL